MPVALEQPQIHYSAQRPRLRRARRVLAIVIRLAILAAIVAIFGGGYYLARRGFGREWRYPGRRRATQARRRSPYRAANAGPVPRSGREKRKDFRL